MALKCSRFSQLERCQTRFAVYYAGKYSGRKLHWVLNLSKGEVQATCFKMKYTFQVSTYQIAVLMLYNANTSYTVKEIGELTNIGEEMLLPLLELFLKTNLLRCEGGGKPSDGLKPESRIELFKEYKKYVLTE